MKNLFVSTKTYLIEEKENKIFAYLWVVQENWYLKDGKSVCSGGYSIPYQFVLEKKNDSYVVISSKFPRDGSFYGKDIEEQVSRYYQDN